MVSNTKSFISRSMNYWFVIFIYWRLFDRVFNFYTASIFKNIFKCIFPFAIFFINILCFFKIDEELAKKWLGNGAQPTETVAKLFKISGIEK